MYSKEYDYSKMIHNINIEIISLSSQLEIFQRKKSSFTSIRNEEIKNKFLEESKEKCEPILANGKKEIESTLNVEADRFNDAVKLVIERIVNFNGNS